MSSMGVPMICGVKDGCFIGCKIVVFVVRGEVKGCILLILGLCNR